MSKYKVVIHYSNGADEEDDEVFDTEEAAEEHALDLGGCLSVGAESLNLSNPFENPLDEMEDPELEVIEVDY